MKLGLEAKLAIGIIVGFGLFIAAYYAYTARLGKKNSREITIFEEFNSPDYNSRLVTKTTGGSSFRVKNGALSMSETALVTDAGIVMISDNLDIAKPITIKTRVRFYNMNAPGWYGPSSFSIAQIKNAPGILGGFWGLIYVVETPEGNVRLIYRDSASTDKCWNGKLDKWETCTPQTVSSFGPPNVYHTVEFYSDGEKWNIVLKDAAGKILEKTAPIPWKGMLDKGGPYSFHFGEPGLGYYYSDMDVDFIYASYEPE